RAAAGEDRAGGRAGGRAQPLLERHATHERHDEKRDVVPGIEIVYAHDVGVLEPGSERGLAPEPLAPHGAGRDVGRQDFDGDDVAERAMAGPEHRAHAAGDGETTHGVAVADGTLHYSQDW